ncbi:MAG: glycosyltransferase family 39 protein [Acidobacteriota bacterium]|nr:glycosyltransferase family 39 protein [Acidobacteriota bacterium]
MIATSSSFDLEAKVRQDCSQGSPSAPAGVTERQFRALFAFCIVAAAALLIASIGESLWARHELTQVESIVALHATMFANGGGLYHDWRHYPFTVAAYGPIFYTVLAGMYRLGMPLFLGCRLISIAALLAEFWLAWRILGFLISNQYARVTGLLLAVSAFNLLTWGTVGQTDTLSCCFSLAAFWQFLNWREHRNAPSLLASGALVILAIFTKQTALAAGGTIAICMLVEDRKTAAQWIASVGIALLALVLGLNALTHGRYFDDAVLANMNPMHVAKLIKHVKFFLFGSAGVLVVMAAGLKFAVGRLAPLYVYTALAACLWLATCPKAGSDTNYQIEIGILIALCAACSLDRLWCFPKLFAGSTATAVVLLFPLLLNGCVNLLVGGINISGRISTELLQRVREPQIAPFVKSVEGRILSVEFDPLMKFSGRIDVEPLIYVLLVKAGRIDPAPVLEDLEARRFSALILFRNVFAAPARWEGDETLCLTDTQMDAVRRNYRLVKHVKGPYLDGDYIYEPRRD